MNSFKNIEYKQLKSEKDIKELIVTEQSLPNSFDIALCFISKAKELASEPLTEDIRKEIEELIKEALTSLEAPLWFVTTPPEQREQDIKAYLSKWEGIFSKAKKTVKTNIGN